MCVFGFNCGNVKSLKKEFIKWAKEEGGYENYSFELKNFTVGRNSNNQLFFYAVALMSHNSIDYNASGEVFVSTKSGKIIVAVSNCVKNCNHFLKNFSYMFKSAGLLTKKTESQIETTSSDLVEGLKELNKLYEDGVLTKEEFEKAKKKLLN